MDTWGGKMTDGKGKTSQMKELKAPGNTNRIPANQQHKPVGQLSTGQWLQKQVTESMLVPMQSSQGYCAFW